VVLHHKLLTDGWASTNLRLIFGTRWMHASWVWGGRYPDFMDALMADGRVCRCRLRGGIACGEDGDGWIRKRSGMEGGEYTTQPLNGLRIAEDFLIIAGSAPGGCRRLIRRG